MKNVLLSKLTKLTLVSSLLFFACSNKASAEVNTKILNSAIKSCQKNPPKDNSLFKVLADAQGCVKSRYYYISFMSVFNGLNKLGDLRKGFPSSIMIAYLTETSVDQKEFLDCMISKNYHSSECNMFKFGSLARPITNSFSPYICSSCFEAYSTVGSDGNGVNSNLGKPMLQDVFNWFYKLDKPSRKLVIDSLSNSNFFFLLREESQQAAQLYLKLKEKVERDTQQQKRRDLLN